MYAWQDERSAADFQAALHAAKQDAERVTNEFVAGLGPSSHAYVAEWTTRFRQLADRTDFRRSRWCLISTVTTLIYVTTPAKRLTPLPRTCADGLSAPRSMTGVRLRRHRYRLRPRPPSSGRQPDSLSQRYAEEIAETGRIRLMDAALRRGIEYRLLFDLP